MDASVWLTENRPETDSWPARDELVAFLKNEIDDRDASSDTLNVMVDQFAFDQREREAIQSLVLAAKRHQQAVAGSEQTKKELHEAIYEAYRAGLEKFSIHKLSGISRPTVDAVIARANRRKPRMHQLPGGSGSSSVGAD